MVLKVSSFHQGDDEAEKDIQNTLLVLDSWSELLQAWSVCLPLSLRIQHYAGHALFLSDSDAGTGSSFSASEISGHAPKGRGTPSKASSSLKTREALHIFKKHSATI